MKALANDYPSLRLCAAALFVGMGGSFHFGYQIMLTNPAQFALTAFVQKSYLDHYDVLLEKSSLDAVWSFVVSLLFGGGIIGSVTLRKLADRFGRKKALMVSFAGILLSGVLSVLSYFLNSFELFIVARFTMGLSICMSLGLCGMFLTECSPKQCRGKVAMSTGIFVQLGLFSGSVVGIPTVLGDKNTWWLMYLVEVIIVAGSMALFSLCHETPGYLLFKGRENAARASVQFYYNCELDELDGCIREIRENMSANSKALGMFEVLRHESSRTATIVGATTGFAMTCSGVAVLCAFAVEMLKNTGMSVLQASIANAFLAFVTLVGSLVAAAVIDRSGRRPLLISTVFGILVCNLLIFLFLRLYNVCAVNWAAWALIVVIALFFVFFTLGPGPLCYFITSEMISQQARSSGQSWAVFTQMSCRFLILVFYLPLRNAIGNDWAYLLMFVAPMIYCVVFLYYLLPETKNKNIMEVEEERRHLPRLPWAKLPEAPLNRTVPEQRLY